MSPQKQSIICPSETGVKQKCHEAGIEETPAYIQMSRSVEVRPCTFPMYIILALNPKLKIALRNIQRSPIVLCKKGRSLKDIYSLEQNF